MPSPSADASMALPQSWVGIDWAATAIGPPERWPNALCGAVRMCLDAQPLPAAVWAGPELIVLCNDAYAAAVGDAMAAHIAGHSASWLWPQWCDELAAELQALMAHGHPILHRDQPSEGDGSAHSLCCGSLLPLRDESGHVLAALHLVEHTGASAGEEAAREEAIATTLKTARIGVWELDLTDMTARQSILHGPPDGDRRVPSWTYDRFLDRIVPEEREQVHRRLTQAIEAGSPWSLECQMRRGDGQIRWIWAAGSCAGPQDRRRMIGILQDVTERKLAQEALLAAESRSRASEAVARRRLVELDSVYEAASVGLCEFDNQLQWIRANASMAGMSGRAAADHIGKTPRELVPALAEQFEGAMKTVMDTRQRLDLEMRGTTPARAGVERCWSERWIPMFDERERMIGVTVAVEELPGSQKTHPAMADGEEPLRLPADNLLVSDGCAAKTDVTRQRATEEALQVANEQLHEADRRKNEFLAMLSHELRNPLAPIQNSLYILDRSDAGSRQARHAREVISRQVAHLTRLIDDLLDVTRVSRGKIRLLREPLDLREIVARTAEDHCSLFAANHVELDVVPAARPVYALVDGPRIAQVVGNLLTNAAKFTESGGRVVLSVEGADGVAAIHVRDTGVGIAPDLLPKLFEPFVQADRTLDRSMGGLGLGLALVQGLVELHGGHVQVHSDGPGTGAEFVVTLPMEPAAEASGSDAPASAGAPASAALRVLVIEDNADAADTLREALTIAGHDARTASTGAQGLESARQWRPDVVLCDLGLPDISGFEVARRMKADAALQGVPLVALSGYAAPADVALAADAGFCRHLSKPADFPTLQRTLLDVCSTQIAS